MKLLIQMDKSHNYSARVMDEYKILTTLANS